MNIDNFKIARQWVVDTPEEEFDMTDWFRFPKGEDLTGWQDRDKGLVYAETVFREYGELPCGTAGCLAGTIAYNMDTTKQDRQTKSVKKLARDFLGITWVQANMLFTEPGFYGETLLVLVTKDDVLKKLDEIIETGEL